MLRDLYPALHDEVERKSRFDWIQPKIDELLEPGLYRNDPDDAYLRLKIGNKKYSTVAALYKLARWRENRAQKQNKPRQFILKDELLQIIAQRNPASVAELSQIRNLPTGLAKSKLSNEIWQILQDDLSAEEKTNRRGAVEPVIQASR